MQKPQYVAAFEIAPPPHIHRHDLKIFICVMERLACRFMYSKLIQLVQGVCSQVLNQLNKPADQSILRYFWFFGYFVPGGFDAGVEPQP